MRHHKGLGVGHIYTRLQPDDGATAIHYLRIVGESFTSDASALPINDGDVQGTNPGEPLSAPSTHCNINSVGLGDINSDGSDSDGDYGDDDGKCLTNESSDDGLDLEYDDMYGLDDPLDLDYED